MNAQFLLHALRRWWKVALPVGLLLAAVAAAVVYWLFEPQYEAAALLEINERPQYIAFEPKDAGVSKAYFRTQIEIIRSRWIMGRAVANERIKQLPEIRKQRDPIGWLKKRVSVVSANGSDVFEIKYSSADPENAALVVNEVTQQYLTAQEEEEAKRTRNIVAALMRGNEVPGKGRQDAAHPSADRDAAGFGQGTGACAARPELPGQEPAGGVARPAGHRSGRARDAQWRSIKAGEEELRAAERAERRPERCPGEGGGSAAVQGRTRVARRHGEQGHRGEHGGQAAGFAAGGQASGTSADRDECQARQGGSLRTSGCRRKSPATSRISKS